MRENGRHEGSRKKRERKRNDEENEKKTHSGEFFIKFQHEQALHPWLLRFLLQKPEANQDAVSITQKINEDTVQEPFSPFSTDGILHFLALIHLLSSSLGAADILLL